MATQEEISRVRRRIGDGEKHGLDSFTGDGETTTLNLEFKNVYAVEVTINQATLPPVAYTLNQKAGKLILEAAPAQDDKIIVNYKYAGYTDEDIEVLINNYGVEGAIVEALQELLVDSARLYDYQQGQTVDKRSQVFDHLKDLLKSAKDDFVATKSNGVRLGRRNPDERKPSVGRVDLSRDDKWSDNNA